MLKEITEEIIFTGRGADPTAQSLFCEEALKEFAASEMKQAEVTNFPSGKTAQSVYPALRQKARRMGFDGITVRISEGKVYLVRKLPNGRE